MNLQFNWLQPSISQAEAILAEKQVKAKLSRSELAHFNKPLSVSFMPSFTEGSSLIAIVEELSRGTLLAAVEMAHPGELPTLTTFSGAWHA